MTRQNAYAFCHPEGVFTPLPPAKNVKTTVRIQFIYVSAVPTAFLITWILRYTQNDTKRGCVLFTPATVYDGSPPHVSPTKFCNFVGPDWGGIGRDDERNKIGKFVVEFYYIPVYHCRIR